jgi:uncharacterized SAM-binding protein YcdF (DUF218 family)
VVNRLVVMDLLFALKKIAARFLFPLPVVMELLLLGLILLWFTRKQKAGKVLVTCAAVLLLFLGTGILSKPLLSPLEDAYPSFDAAAHAHQDLRWVVVLGGGGFSSPHPLPTGLTSESLFRIIEGLRILRQLPEAKLLVSGGWTWTPDTDANRMRTLALSLGVDEERIVVEAETRDTEEQAVEIGRIVGDAPFVLVTTADHMRRSMLLFQAQGLDPIPAPTGHSYGDEPASLWDLFPWAREIRSAERAVYEYLGMAWSSLRGRI